MDGSSSVKHAAVLRATAAIIRVTRNAIYTNKRLFLQFISSFLHLSEYAREADLHVPRVLFYAYILLYNCEQIVNKVATNEIFIKKLLQFLTDMWRKGVKKGKKREILRFLFKMHKNIFENS